MKTNEFDGINEAQLDRVQARVTQRTIDSDYEDQLHSLKQAAQLQDVTLREAMSGYMADHTIKLYDMLQSPAIHTMETWEDIITKQMVDLLLVNAVVKEEDMDRKGLNEVAVDISSKGDPVFDKVVDAPTAGELSSQLS